MLLVIAAVSVIFALSQPKKYIWPVIAVIAALGGVVSVLSVGGKKWDAGDNQKAGYKNYDARKREQEALEEKENRKKD